MSLKFIRRLAYRAALRLPFPCRRLAWQTFLDTHQEWHAFVEGLADGFYPLLRSKYEGKERHYYKAGRAIGFAGFIIFIAAAIVIVVWLVTLAISRT